MRETTWIVKIKKYNKLSEKDNKEEFFEDPPLRSRYFWFLLLVYQRQRVWNSWKQEQHDIWHWPCLGAYHSPALPSFKPSVEISPSATFTLFVQAVSFFPQKKGLGSDQEEIKHLCKLLPILRLFSEAFSFWLLKFHLHQKKDILSWKFLILISATALSTAHFSLVSSLPSLPQQHLPIKNTLGRCINPSGDISGPIAIGFTFATSFYKSKRKPLVCNEEQT